MHLLSNICYHEWVQQGQYTDWLTYILLLPHLAGVVLSFHALRHSHSPQGSIAWILGLMLLPYATIPLYLALGVGRIKRHTNGGLPQRSVDLFIEQLDATPATGPAISLSRAGSYPTIGGNHVHILRDALSTYQSLGDAILQAQKSILLEFFIIRNDLVGDNLRLLLEQKAREGVQVYVIYDEVGSHKLPRGYLKALLKAGVHVASFNGRRYWLSSFIRLNYRNHRKLVVIDSEMAFLGSLNVGLEYVKRPRKRYWRDTFVHLRGPIVLETLLSFVADWWRATGEDLSHLATSQQNAGKIHCQLIPSGPDNAMLNLWELTIMELAGQAKERFWITSPYFVPSDAVKVALQAAAQRGVDVRVIIPREGDNILANYAMLTYLPDMIQCGVKMLAYLPGVLHEKVTLMDKQWCSIGTANLDERSLHLNFELTLLFEGEEMAGKVEAMLEEDMAQCVPFCPDDMHKATPIVRVIASFCRLLAPML